MNTLLKFRRQRRSSLPASAWYIPGADAALWLRELASWPVPHADVRTLLVPRSRGNRSPAGLLCLLPKGQDSKGAGPHELGSREQAPQASPTCMPYVSLAERLYLPADAGLDPPVTDAELERLMLDSCLYVWHPAAGLICYEQAELLPVSALLTMGPAVKRRWDLAQAGIALPRQLVSLTPAEFPTLEMIIQQGQSDIGSDSGSLDRLPAAPNEPGLLDAAALRAKQAVAAFLHWAAKHTPRSGTKEGWVNHLENWAQRKLQRIQEGLEARRQKQITRLLHLLSTDPDKGLRHALPLGGDAHRGMAPPSDRLGTRDLSFNLGQLAGGRPADVWHLSEEHRQQLIQRYRELANREMLLGRHRRAAYILGVLLFDLEAAAKALVAGQHFREAAVIYQERLKRPHDAAKCLEQGGLWHEAIELYRKLGKHEEAGDAFLRIEQPAAAESEFRQAVAQFKGQADYLSAARLLEEKLGTTEEALHELKQAWPYSTQARLCLQKAFQILGQTGQHRAAETWINELSADCQRETMVHLAEVLSKAATQYPDASVNRLAADRTRLLVSKRLPTVGPGETQSLLRFLGQLVPGDLLLDRDCQRYGRMHSGTQLAKARKTPVGNHRLRLLNTLKLGASIAWRTAISSGDYVYAAGTLGGHLLVMRCSWKGESQPLSAGWVLSRPLANRPIVLCASPLVDSHLLVHVPWQLPHFQEAAFAQTDTFPDRVLAGSHGGVSSYTIGAARSTAGLTWLLIASEDHWVLAHVDRHGKSYRTQKIDLHAVVSDVDDSAWLAPDPEDPEGETWRLRPAAQRDMPALPVPIYARPDKVYVAAQNHLCIFDHGKHIDTLHFDEPILSMAGSMPVSQARIALNFPRGTKLLWDNPEGPLVETVTTDLLSPIAVITRGGILAVASDRSLEVHRTHRGQTQFLTRVDDLPETAIALLGGPQVNQLGVLCRGGRLQMYEIT